MTPASQACRVDDHRHLAAHTMPRKNANRDLGRALANKKDRAKAAANHKKKAADTSDAARHATDEAGRPQLRSVLESNDLEELMLNATMANKDFAAQRYAGPVAPQTVVVTPMGATTAAARARVRRKIEEMDSSVLKVPRRPAWDGDTTARELQKQEADDFLVWRRRIADLEEELAHEQGHAGVMLTPFEKNLEVWRQLWRVVERSDIVVQIVDARNPLLYYCADLTRYVEDDMKRGHMLVLNKADLLSSAMITRWQEYFKEQGVDVAFFSAFKASVSEDVHDPRIVGAEELIARLAGSPRTAPVQHPRLVVGMCGYPNVGKSSTINVLLDTVAEAEENAAAEAEAETADVGSTDGMSTATGAEKASVAAKRVAVSSTPGRTKHFQTLVLTDEVLLCDCPGLVFPNFSASKAELICAGVLSIDQMRADTNVPIELIARRIPAAVFEGVYGIRFEAARANLLSDGRAEADLARGIVDATTLLETHARARGFMTDHGRPDGSRSARAVLKDYVSGRVRFAHAPPPNDEEEGESGVGPDVFAKKGRLVIARREAAAKDSNAAAAAAATEGAKLLEGMQEEKAKPVVARVSQRKKHAHVQFTRVERNYSSGAN